MGTRAPDTDVADYLNTLREAFGGTVPDLCRHALRFAADAHHGQTRRSGEPYITHPLAAACELASEGFDPATVAAGLCHDVLEDCGVTAQEMTAALGAEVTAIVEGVTRIGAVRKTPGTKAADMARLIGSIAGDERVLAVKLADRLHNMTTLDALPEEKRRRIATETLEIFAPLAHRSGADRWAAQLADLGFRYAKPDKWEELDVALELTGGDRDQMSKEAETLLGRELGRAKIKASVTSRTKGRWSLWLKMTRDNRALSEIDDVVGVRVVAETIPDCYAALGVAHSTFLPVPGKVKDYIALPKSNGYQSLHTTVMDDKGRRFEVQIRTTQMDQTARFGSAAAHHRYKNALGAIDSDPDLTAPESFLDELRGELAQQSDVLILTPGGDVITLPVGACAIDFAYAIHTDIGHRCVGANVNGQLRPLRMPLHSGDQVEILTGSEPNPSASWLDSVVTAKARTNIRRWLAHAGHPLDDAALPPTAALDSNKRSFVGLRLQPATCCCPTDSDELVGYLTPRRSVVVHTASCRQVPGLQDDGGGRLMRLARHSPTAIVELRGRDGDGLLAAAAGTFTSHGVNITASVSRTSGGAVVEQFACDTNDPSILGQLCAALNQLPGVTDARVVPQSRLRLRRPSRQRP